jgi:hypothetical protein
MATSYYYGKRWLLATPVAGWLFSILVTTAVSEYKGSQVGEGGAEASVLSAGCCSHGGACSMLPVISVTNSMAETLISRLTQFTYLFVQVISKYLYSWRE